LVEFFFFQKKKQKALFCFAEGYGLPNLPRSGTTGVWGLAPKKLFFLKSTGLVAFFFFQKKKQKALFCFAEGYGLPNLPRKGCENIPTVSSLPERKKDTESFLYHPMSLILSPTKVYSLETLTGPDGRSSMPKNKSGQDCDSSAIEHFSDHLKMWPTGR
jgi:hypothetical protein